MMHVLNSDLSMCSPRARPRPQKILDKTLPNGPHLDILKVPGIDRASMVRTTRHLHFLPPHEALAAEAHNSQIRRPEDMELPQCYFENPIVQAAQEAGQRLPHPCIIFIDGVRYRSALAGRGDSVLGIWLRTFASGTRHLLCALSVSQFCRCGCKGWCTIFPVLCAIAHSFIHMARGQRPACKPDGSARLPGDPYSVDTTNQSLGFTAMLMWITGFHGCHMRYTHQQ